MLRYSPIPRVMYRQNLLMGGERLPVLCLLLLCIGMSVTSANIYAYSIALFLWISGIFALRWMAKIDPYLIRTYLQSVKYRGYYFPRSTIWVKNCRPHSWWDRRSC